MRQLSEAAGVSGEEDEVRRLVAAEARRYADRVETDVMGNLFAYRYAAGGGKGTGQERAPVVMLAAHMDEVGLLIASIDADGSLRFRPVGGIDPRVLAGKAVLIGPRRVPGVIGVRPIHLQKPEERGKAEPVESLAIDIGASSREQAEKAVKVGDRAVFPTPFTPLGAGRAMGKAFDDRVGCAVLLRVLQQAYPVTVAAAFTVQEEVGLRGAQVAAYRVEPDLALVLEGTTCADIPGTEPHAEATRLGEGPALSVMDMTSIASPRLVRELAAVAEREGIKYQWRRTAAGGNDAGAIHVSRMGVPSATVSVPCRYIHSPAAIVDLSDVEAAARLVSAFLAGPAAALAASWKEPAGLTRAQRMSGSAPQEGA